jgi:hypothetical protein
MFARIARRRADWSVMTVVLCATKSPILMIGFRWNIIVYIAESRSVGVRGYIQAFYWECNLGYEFDMGARQRFFNISIYALYSDTATQRYSDAPIRPPKNIETPRRPNGRHGNTSKNTK